MPLIKKFLIVFSTVSLVFGSINAQNEIIPLSASQLKGRTEKLLGMDDLLVNGKRYLPEHTKVVGSPEFEFQDAGNSAVYIKGQRFDNILLAYDIVSDLLILVQTLGNGLENRIQLHPVMIDSFRLGNHLFINPSNFLTGFVPSGFYEKISDGKVLYLKKHSKHYLQIYDASNRGKYSSRITNNYLLDRNGTLIPVNNRQSFLKYFAPYKKAIKSYLHDEGISFKKAGNPEIIRLMSFCNALT